MAAGPGAAGGSGARAGSGAAGSTGRATSFGGVAEAYSRHRPGPPHEAVRWLLPAHRPARAVDLGAGTGALAERLVPHVGEVVAVDIDPRMLAVARRRVPGAALAVARAEALPLADASVDLVGVSSAWHWVDPDRALPEVARVLRPGGVLGLLWGGPDRSVDWVGELLSGGHHGDDPGRPEHGRRRWRDTPVVPPGVALAAPEERSFSTSIPYAVADLPGLAASYSTVITLPPEARRVEDARIRALVEGLAAEVGADGDVALPLTCRAIRLARLG